MIYKIFFLLFFVCRSLFASSFDLQPAAFVRLGLHPGVIALGGTGVVSARGASGLIYNPAALFAGETYELGCYNATFFDTHFRLIDAKFDFFSFPMAINYLQARFQAVPIVELNPMTGFYQQTAAVTYYEGNQIQLGVAFYYFKRLRLGGSVKFIYESMDAVGSKALGADIGLLYCFKQGNLGLMIHNVVEPYFSWTSSLATPAVLNSWMAIGGSYIFWRYYMTMYGSVDVFNRRIIAYHFGVNYQPIWFFDFRAGLDNGFFTVGTQLMLDLIHIDIAWKQSVIDYFDMFVLGVTLTSKAN
tara:strand:+ start:159 stop:1061 length:903 start_codon:yes stop_codon:yes gene_type:complete